MAWTSLCELGELQEGKGKYVEIEGHQLAVFLHGGQVYVIDNHCPHAGGNLAGGDVEDGCAVCPWHHWMFKLDTGYLRGTTAVKVSTYPVRVLKRTENPHLVQADLPMP